MGIQLVQPHLARPVTAGSPLLSPLAAGSPGLSLVVLVLVLLVALVFVTVVIAAVEKPLHVLLGVAVQVEFEKEQFFETRRFQAMGHNCIQLVQPHLGVLAAQLGVEVVLNGVVRAAGE
jgi:hypothetical protein